MERETENERETEIERDTESEREIKRKGVKEEERELVREIHAAPTKIS